MSETALLDRVEGQPAPSGGISAVLDVKRIASDAVVKLVTFCGAKIYETVKAKHQDHSAKTAVDYGQAFERYLVAASEKYGRTKTLLYRKEARDLYDFYECIGVLHGIQTVSTEEIQNLLDLGHFLLITGTGGIGKSTMLKHLFLSTIRTTQYIPIFVELRAVNDRDLTISDCIYENLKNLGFNLERKYFEYSLEAGCFVFLFDGYDEVRQSKTAQISAEIKSLCDRYPDNYFILSSRPTDDFIGWNRFIELEAKRLTKRQAVHMILRLDYNPLIKEKFLHALQNGLFEKHESFASNPLLLTIMLLTFEDHASIPEKLHSFYEQAFVTLFNRHDATKDGYVRDIRSGLSIEEFKRMFAHFCFKSYFQSDYEFSEGTLTGYIEQSREQTKLSGRFTAAEYISDLTNSVCMLIQEGFTYRFTHRSFQEYFAALCTVGFSDEVQRSLLTQWFQEHPSAAFRGGYTEILIDIEEERFIRNAVLPFLRKLRQEYEQSGRSPYWVLKRIYQSVRLDVFPVGDPADGSDDNAQLGLGFTIKSPLYQQLMELVWTRYAPPNQQETEDEREVDERVTDYVLEKYGMDTGISFDEIERSDVSDDFIRYSEWIFRRFRFAMEFLERYEQNAPSAGQSLEDLIRSL